MTKWQIYTIGDLVREKVIFPPVDGNHGEIHPKGDDFVSDGIPFVMASDINDSSIDLIKCKFITKEHADRLRKGFVNEGDVLLTHKATIGRTAIVPKTKYPYLMLTPQVTYYRVINERILNNRFLKYYFDYKPFQETLGLWAGAGSTRAYLGITGQHNLTVRIPDIETQNNIANVLSTIDKKIQLNNRINAELEAMAKTLYDYWFVQFDFPDANGKPYKTSGGRMVYNPTLKREIPEGWEVKKLIEITSVIRRGISPKYTEYGGTPVLNQKCVRDQKISFEDARRHQVVLEDKDERLLKPFDVLINSTGVGTLGRVAYVKRLIEKKTTIDSHLSIVRANPALVSSQYLAWSLMRHQPVIELAANGSTGQVELSKSFLESIDVIIPVDILIKKFTEFVKPLVSTLAKRESENEQLICLRDWLLPMLMNGQVSIKL